MNQTAHAQTASRLPRRIDDVKAPPIEAAIQQNEPAHKTDAPALVVKKPSRRSGPGLPYVAITVAVMSCMVLCALAWYAYRH